MEDVVAQYPEEIALYQKQNGKLPENLEYESHFYAVLNKERFWIHARATLPLKDLSDGIGFGLWVELSHQDFLRYLDASEDNQKYKSFSAEGKLANQWPGFENILGIPVTVRAVRENEIIYITEIKIDKPRDPLFEFALNCAADDTQTKQQIRNLVHAYLEENKPTS